jgi:hypothetical protein
MALLWAESFDIYGTSAAALLLRGYLSSEGFLTTTVPQPRTGAGAYVLGGGSNNEWLVRVLDAPVNVIGAGAAWNCVGAPSNALNEKGMVFGTASTTYKVSVTHNANLGLTAWLDGVAVGTSANNVYVIGSYYYLEVKVTNNTFGGGLNTGTITVKANGVIVLVVNGLNITEQFINHNIGQYNKPGGNSPGGFYVDDWIIWDNSGTENNDFLGDRKVVTSMPSANGALQDWAASAGTAYQCIDEIVPSDVDYIQANVAGDISEFEKQLIGISTNDICAAVVVVRALKDDAGSAEFRIGINSAGNVSNGSTKLPNTTAAYFNSIFPLNPDGNVQWTKAALDAALIRVTRDV